MMKILILSIIDPRSSAHNRLHYLIEALREQHEVTILTVRDHWKEEQDAHGVFLRDSRKVLDSVKVISFTKRKIHPVWQEALSFFTLTKVIRRNGLDKVDCVLNYNSIVSGVVVGSFFRKRNIPIIVDFADDLAGLVRHSPQLPIPLRHIASWVAAYMVRRVCKSATRMVVAARPLLRHIPPAKHAITTVIPNGVYLKQFRSQATPYHSLQRPYLLGYVGVLREWVDFTPVFRTIARLRTEGHAISLVIVGKEGRYHEVIASASRNGISNYVKFLGSRSYQEIPKLIHSFNAGIIPFVINDVTIGALPLKLFEYAAASIPIISSPLPEVKRIAGGVVEYAQSEEEWYSACLRLMRIRVSPQYMFLQQYDWSIITKQYVSLIQSAMT